MILKIFKTTHTHTHTPHTRTVTSLQYLHLHPIPPVAPNLLYEPRSALAADVKCNQKYFFEAEMPTSDNDGSRAS